MIGLIPPPGTGNYKYKPAPVNVQEPLPSANQPNNVTNYIKKPPGGIKPPPPGAAGGGGLLPILPALILAIPQVLLFDSPTADEDAILKKLLQPPGKPQELQPAVFPFTGGQGDGIKYKVVVQVFVEYTTGTSTSTYCTSYFWGAIGAISLKLIPRNDGSGHSNITVVANCRGGNIPAPSTYGEYQGAAAIGVTPSVVKRYYMATPVVTRLDAQPDTNGNPPPTSPPIISQPEPIKANPERLKPDRPQQPVPPVPDFPFPTEPYVPETPEPKNPLPRLPLPPIQPEITIPPFEPIGDLDITSPTNQTIPPPAVIIGPSADPGKTKIIKPSSVPDDAKDFKLDPTNPVQPFTPVEPTKPKTPTIDPPAEKDPITKLREDIDKIIPLIPTIANNTNPNTIKEGTREVVCNSFKPGGCNADIRNNSNTAANNGSRLDALNALMQGLDLSLLKVIDDKLGPKLPGGLAGKLGRVSRWLRIDRAWNMLIYAAVLHNAWMLSSSFGQTLIAATDSFINAFILKDDEGQSFSVGEVIGKQVKGLAESIFGKQTVSYWETQYKKYVRVYQAAANLLSSLSNIGYSILSVLEIVGSRISKIGNALRWYGVVEDKAYSAMNEADNFQIPILTKINNLEQAASTIDTVSTEVKSVKDTAKEMKAQKTELDKALKNATDTYDKDEKKDRDSIKNPDYLDSELE